MPVHDVAEWYATYGERLFTQNIRRSLGLTDVNHELQSTLREGPENFWYFNNGITMLCDSLRKTPHGSTNAAGDFRVIGASVVNGAQTVAAIHETVRENRDAVSLGRVWVRMISLESAPPDFASAVTKATNTQNQVVDRDFVALDTNQTRLREDFMLSLRKTYVFKRGEPEPRPTSGCSVLEAARALACAHVDPSYAARAKQDGPVLWETGPKGTYNILFGQPPGAFRVWRCVQVLRTVRSRLDDERGRREGRAAMVVSQADFLCAHLVFRQLDLASVDDPAFDWESELQRAGKLATSILDRLIFYVDDTYGAGSFLAPTFRNAERCSELAALVIRDLRAGNPAPELPAAYRSRVPEGRSRRENAVSILVDAGRIDNGTRLEFRPATGPERRFLMPWIAQDPRRGQATWVNNRVLPLLWAADGKRYSPSGLVKYMLDQAGLTIRAVQGPSRWFIREEGSLVEIADQMRG
jgi:hypothetical protein